jgi:serine/threonine protein kinase
MYASRLEIVETVERLCIDRRPIDPNAILESIEEKRRSEAFCDILATACEFGKNLTWLRFELLQFPGLLSREGIHRLLTDIFEILCSQRRTIRWSDFQKICKDHRINGLHLKFECDRFRLGETIDKSVTLTERITHGGVAVVYRGVLSNGKRVLVRIPKIWERSGPDLYSSQMLKENKLRKSLQPFGVPQQLFLLRRYISVEEFIDGETLADLKASGNFTTEDYIESVASVARILEPLHRQQIVHGDVTPNNIIVSEVNNKSYLLDFNMAIDQRDGLDSVLGGTNGFMSGDDRNTELTFIDHRHDIYALGATLLYLSQDGNVSQSFEAFSATLASNTEDVGDSTKKLLDSTPLGSLLKGCLARDRDQRFLTAKDFRDKCYALLDKPDIEVQPKKSRILLAWQIGLSIGRISQSLDEMEKVVDDRIGDLVVGLVNLNAEYSRQGERVARSNAKDVARGRAVKDIKRQQKEQVRDLEQQHLLSKAERVEECRMKREDRRKKQVHGEKKVTSVCPRSQSKSFAMAFPNLHNHARHVFALEKYAAQILPLVLERSTLTGSSVFPLLARPTLSNIEKLKLLIGLERNWLEAVISHFCNRLQETDRSQVMMCRLARCWSSSSSSIKDQNECRSLLYRLHAPTWISSAFEQSIHKPSGCDQQLKIRRFEYQVSRWLIWCDADQA